MKKNKHEIANTFLVTTPSKSELVEQVERIIQTPKGDFVRYVVYTVLPEDPAGGNNVLNLYGQMIYNQQLQRRKKNGIFFKIQQRRKHKKRLIQLLNK